MSLQFFFGGVAKNDGAQIAERGFCISLGVYFSMVKTIQWNINLPASSKWPFDTPNEGHSSHEKVTYRSKRGHFEKPGGNNGKHRKITYFLIGNGGLHLGVKLMEINRNLFSRKGFNFSNLPFRCDISLDQGRTDDETDCVTHTHTHEM